MSVPLSPGSKEAIGVLRVELEGFSYVGPAQRAGWEREFAGSGSREGGEELEEEDNKSNEEAHGSEGGIHE